MEKHRVMALCHCVGSGLHRISSINAERLNLKGCDSINEKQRSTVKVANVYSLFFGLLFSHSCCLCTVLSSS